MSSNPYSLTFGKEPPQIISRVVQIEEVIRTFTDEQPAQQVFIITGIRGSGKTVLMTEISKMLACDSDWIAVELNPERDMLTALAAKLSSEDKLAALFKTAKLNLSFFGFGLEVSNAAPINDIEIALEKMLEVVKKQGKRLLITIDEASNTKNMRSFVSAFQILIRKDLPVFLLMTGLYDNISALQDENNLTFLYRAPKIELRPLNLGAIADNYRANLALDDETALKMARMTKGYSFAFQVLGHYTWENGGLSDVVVSKFRHYLEEYVYEKIWSESSATDRKILFCIAKSKSGKVSEIRELAGMESNQFSPYRKRLIRKGLINGDAHGYITFALPMFERFIIENYLE